MPTNIPTIEPLKRMAELIDSLEGSSDKIRELKTWNKLFKRHIGEQKSQGGQFPKDTYECDWKNNKIRRLRNGEVMVEY